MCDSTLTTSQISELLHAALHAIAGPSGQIHRIGALIERRGVNMDDELRSWLSYLSSATKHLDESLEAIRRYAEVIDLPCERARFPLMRALKPAMKSLPSGAAAIESGELPEVEADAKRFELLFGELLSNASKFRADRALAVQVSAATENGDLVVSVADNGIGIEPNQTQRIFKPFVRLWGDRFPGPGIGLAIARTIVETWNGRIWVDSVVGEGSTFRFTLPAVNP